MNKNSSDSADFTAPSCVWPAHTQILGKPVWYCRSRPWNAKSGFAHKLLCDGFTFTGGTSCAYSCRYCYVESQVLKQKPVLELLQRSRLRFDQVVLRRANAQQQLARALTWRATAKHPQPRCEELLPPQLLRQLGLENRVARFKGVPFAGKTVYGSPLVDLCATRELAAETVELCELLLRLTDFQIRLLSKSPLLASAVARPLSSRLPASKARVIYGLSLGTVGDGTPGGDRRADALARAIEPDAPSPSRRRQALRWLQQNQFRTFGMLCPVLPQADPAAYARGAMQAIQAEQCEHVWAEPFNLRVQNHRLPPAPGGVRNSFEATLAGLAQAGFAAEAQRFERETGNPQNWDRYCETTFEAFARCAPWSGGQPKLRWLQYPRNRQQALAWAPWQARGALLLGGVVTLARKQGLLPA